MQNFPTESTTERPNKKVAENDSEVKVGFSIPKRPQPPHGGGCAGWVAFSNWVIFSDSLERDRPSESLQPDRDTLESPSQSPSGSKTSRRAFLSRLLCTPQGP